MHHDRASLNRQGLALANVKSGFLAWGRWRTCYASGDNKAGGLPAKTLQRIRSSLSGAGDFNWHRLQKPKPCPACLQRFCPDGPLVLLLRAGGFLSFYLSLHIVWT
jgi:hypothetical protein